MSFVKELEHYKKARKSVRKLLNIFGVSAWNVLSMPLRSLSEKEAVAVVFNWITKHLLCGKKIAIRFRDEETKVGYTMWLENRRRVLYVTNLKECKKQQLYCWPADMIPRDITTTMIKRSMQDA